MGSGISKSKASEEVRCNPVEDTHELLKSLKRRMDSDVAAKRMKVGTIEQVEELNRLLLDFQEQQEAIADKAAEDGAAKMFTEYWKAFAENERNETLDTAVDMNYIFLAPVKSLCCNYSDSSLKFRDCLGRTEIFPLLVSDLTKYRQNMDDEQVKDCIVSPSLTILLNCAKAPDNKKYLRMANAVKILMDYSKVDDVEIKVIAMLAIAYIIDEEENELISTDGSIIDFLLRYAKIAIQSDGHRHEGFSAEELVEGLMNLARNDKNKITIVEGGVLPILEQLLEDGSDREKVASAKTAWELSFCNENKKAILEESNLVESLQLLAESPGPAKDAASGALWKLQEEQRRVLSMHQNVSSLQSQKQQQLAGGAQSSQRIMISYQWKYQNLMLRIMHELEERGYNVWMDVNEMKGSKLDAMADAVEKSGVVLVCLSQTYKDSRDCRSEAGYAYELQKQIIPLRVERNYKPDGWLGILLSEKIYFDFSSPTGFAGTLSKLVNELGNRGREGKQPTKTSSSALVSRPAVGPASITHSRRTPVENYTREEVAEWASSNKISIRKVAKLDGRALIFLHGLKSTAPEFFYKYVSEKIGISKLEDLMNLCDALDSLDV